jgi:hypothetical protein
MWMWWWIFSLDATNVTDPLLSFLSPQVPFVGKDVPSRASEFSHPDIVIGLTIAAYRYEGLRFKDFHAILR